MILEGGTNGCLKQGPACFSVVPTAPVRRRGKGAWILAAPLPPFDATWMVKMAGVVK